MSKSLYSIPPSFATDALVTKADYRRLYAESIKDPERFWMGIGRRIDWIKEFTKVKDSSFDADDFRIRWFYDGKLNVSANCLDRQLEKRGDKTAIVWEPDDPRGVAEHITYRQLYERVCQCANALKSLGVEKGDRVTIYLPMIPEIAIAMLACARIGAIHSVVFAGFSSEALGGRIADCKSSVLITADEALRGGKRIALKQMADGALSIPGTDCVKHVLVVRRTGAEVPMYAARDRWYIDLVSQQAKSCPPEAIDAEDSLFILYTSGSTGKPKGVLHTTGGYLVYAAFTHQTIFDIRDDDIYWCTADIGWVTGHSYIVYGPLANGATSLMFEGVPNYPDFGRFWQVVDKHGVTILYSSPTAI
ncbi:MAG TPA: AMP-binding protein, partial [Steroidobacteraceae bacterium]|nr:AMP-binding protein [Steroidobacteraceae bacterium]